MIITVPEYKKIQHISKKTSKLNESLFDDFDDDFDDETDLLSKNISIKYEETELKPRVERILDEFDVENYEIKCTGNGILVDVHDNLYLPNYTDVLRVAFTYKFKRGKLQDLVSLLSGRDFETREYRDDIIEDSYRKLFEGVRAFVDQTNFERFLMIFKSAGIIDESLIRSRSVVNFGYILFLLLKEKGVRPDVIERIVKRWLVMSIITQRYTSSPESQFDVDVRRINEAEDIVQYIEEELARQLNDGFWNGILVENFNTSVASSPYWKIYLAAQITLNESAFLSKDMKVRTLVENRGDVHHIFPKDYLQKNGKNSRVLYNQIANFALIQTETNLQITNKAPNVYMAEVMMQCNTKEATIGSILDREVLEENLRINCIPQGFSKMSIENFDDFLKQRRILMAQKIKEYYYSL